MISLNQKELKINRIFLGYFKIISYLCIVKQLKIRIMDNKDYYEDYDRVKKAFKGFIYALVWESMDIDAGVHEDEINEHITRYCNTNGDQMIALANDCVTKFIKSLS